MGPVRFQIVPFGEDAGTGGTLTVAAVHLIGDHRRRKRREEDEKQAAQRKSDRPTRTYSAGSRRRSASRRRGEQAPSRFQAQSPSQIEPTAADFFSGSLIAARAYQQRFGNYSVNKSVPKKTLSQLEAHQRTPSIPLHEQLRTTLLGGPISKLGQTLLFDNNRRRRKLSSHFAR